MSTKSKQHPIGVSYELWKEIKALSVATGLPQTTVIKLAIRNSKDYLNSL